VESFVASDFWTKLSDTVAGLKDVLEYDDIGEHTNTLPEEFDSPLTSITASPDPHTALFASRVSNASSGYDMPLGLQEWLLSVYKQRVDPIFKPLHWPSALRIISSQEPRPCPNAEALGCATYFTAACSLFDRELDDRAMVIKQCQRAVEQAFGQVGLLTTASLVVLQAFVIYLVSVYIPLQKL
jgi:hypothetical protein